MSTVKDTLADANTKGTMAAYEKAIPQCPYSSVYDAVLYKRWYDSLASELRFIISNKEK